MKMIIIILFITFFFVNLVIATSVSSTYNNTFKVVSSGDRITTDNYVLDIYISETPTGNLSSVNYSNQIGFYYIFELDLRAPNITIISPVNNSQVADTLTTFSFNISDDYNVSKCWYKLTYSNNTIIVDNTTVTNCNSFSTSFSLTNNDYKIFVYSNDTTNNLQITFVTFTKTVITTITNIGGGSGGSSGGSLGGYPLCNTTQFLYKNKCIDRELEPIINWILDFAQDGALEYNIFTKKDIFSLGETITVTNKLVNERGHDIEVNCLNYLDLNRDGKLNPNSEKQVGFSKNIKGNQEKFYYTRLLVPKNTQDGHYLLSGQCIYQNQSSLPATAFTVVEIRADDKTKSIYYSFIAIIMIIGILLSSFFIRKIFKPNVYISDNQ